MAKRRAHVIFFPISYIGHYQPFVQLLYHLDTHRPGIIVTFVGTHNLISDLIAVRNRGGLSSIDLRFYDALTWKPPRYEADPIFPFRAALSSESFCKQVQGLRETLVAKKNEPDAVTSVVSDMFFDWCKDLADELGVPWYTYFSISIPITLVIAEASTILKAIADRQHSPDRAEPLREAIPGLEDFAGYSYIRFGDLAPELFEFPEYYTRLGAKLIQAKGILVNTTEELEQPFGGFSVLKKLMQSSKVFTIGPSLQITGFGQIFSPADPTDNCLPWLDTQRKNSVLFISFGSMVGFQKLIVLEVAASLESSRVPFLWALKLESEQISDVLPPGFQERTAGWGLVETVWVPQCKILEHKATGGFLTHCGWNSIMESICTGVPCLGWPMSADQPANARFIQETKIGVTISSFKTERKETFDSVTRREAEMGIRSLMLEEEGRRARKNIAEMQTSVKAAVAEGGSSYQYLHQFLDELERKP